MATWKNFSAADMPIISQVNAVAGPIGSAFSAAATVAKEAADALSAVSIALNANLITDPLGVIRDQIDDVINDLFETGVFGLVISPKLVGGSGVARGTDGFIRTVKSAMVDPSDTNRPTFSAGDTSAGVLFMVASPDLDGIANLATGLQLLFGDNWTDLINLSAATISGKTTSTPVRIAEGSGVVTSLVAGEDPRQVFVDSSQSLYGSGHSYDPFKGQVITSMGGENTGETAIIESFDNTTKTFRLSAGFRYALVPGVPYLISHDSRPQPPDWASYRVTDAIPVVADVAEALQNARDSMPSYGIGQQMTALQEVLAAKAVAFNLLATTFEDIVQAFDQLSSVTGVYMLPIQPQAGGNGGFIQEAFSASNPPPVGPDDYTLGVVLYGGSGVYDVIGRIFAL